uniref:Uncharacterized protein n=1 Tax=Timema bartmani TaxID=61472 RepID=A0A7R9EVW5_9NEOP|nr:unnamed protein product [Timema bartmani]
MCPPNQVGWPAKRGFVILFRANLAACQVRRVAPEEPAASPLGGAHRESKRRRFHPFRGLRRMFRRKGRHSGSELAETPEKLSANETVAALDSHRSRSTSELLAGDEPNRRR